MRKCFHKIDDELILNVCTPYHMAESFVEQLVQVYRPPPFLLFVGSTNWSHTAMDDEIMSKFQNILTYLEENKLGFDKGLIKEKIETFCLGVEAGKSSRHAELWRNAPIIYEVSFRFKVLYELSHDDILRLRDFYINISLIHHLRFLLRGKITPIPQHFKESIRIECRGTFKREKQFANLENHDEVIIECDKAEYSTFDVETLSILKLQLEKSDFVKKVSLEFRDQKQIDLESEYTLWFKTPLISGPHRNSESESSIGSSDEH